MATIHIPQAEAERDLRTLLSRLDEHTNIVIEGGAGPVAVLHAAPRKQWTLAERVAQLHRNTDSVLDEDFARDVEAGIARHRAPLDSSLWD